MSNKHSHHNTIAPIGTPENRITFCICCGGMRFKKDFGSGFIYAMVRESDHAIKIGLSIDPAKRAKAVNTYLANRPTTLLAYVAVDCMRAAEKAAHALIAHRQLPANQFTGDEWFSLTPTEAADLLAWLEDRSN